jgi:hypothetical protein
MSAVGFARASIRERPRRISTAGHGTKGSQRL